MPFSEFSPDQIRFALDEDLLADAADQLQKYAPYVPRLDEEDGEAPPEDYRNRAARCERRLYRYMKESGNLSGKTLSGVGSRSFKDMAEARRIVRDVMGPYYRGAARAGGTSSVPIV